MLKHHKITKLALGYYHAAALTDMGEVFCWGRGNSGQLGCGNVLSEDTARPVSALESIFIRDI
jgi:alpha-tubulin suppressor-like RCC1 family protein